MSLPLSRVMTALVSISASVLFAQSLPPQIAPVLMPVPAKMTQTPGYVLVTPRMHIAYTHFHNDRLEAGVARAMERLGFLTGLSQSTFEEDPENSDLLQIDVQGAGGTVQGLDEDESYRLQVTGHVPGQGITLTAPTVVGALHGLETLLQLVDCDHGPCRLPHTDIEDAPRFRWRGLMIDVGRHFEPVSAIERTLDGMAVVKMNVFHWHLSDDQGFRAESRIYPRLTSMGSGGLFYTQDQMRDVVAYARARGIRVVPEFDVPGHAVSWLLGYPELGSSTAPTGLPLVFGVHDEALDPSRETTFKFLDGLIGEMAAIFPDAYFHIGGDESNGRAWQTNAKIVAFMQSKGIKNTDALQVYFNQRLLALVQKHGKHMIGWDEVLTPGLPKDVVIQSWRGTDSLAHAARDGYQGILSGPYYLSPGREAEQIYSSDPFSKELSLTHEEESRILGGEACMWGERLSPLTIDAHIWPRAAAAAERFWSPVDVTDTASMYRRLQVTSLRLEAAGLTHLQSMDVMKRSLAGTTDIAALDLLTSLLEPQVSGPATGASVFDTLAEATVTDPAARVEIREQVQRALSGDLAARSVLRERFLAWQNAVPQLMVQLGRSPRMGDAQPRVTQMGQLAQMGLAALSFLDAGVRPPPGWEAQQFAILADAEKRAGMVRFVFLAPLKELVTAASPSPAARGGS